MMDAETIVANQQSLVATAGAILSEFSYDLGAAGTPAPAFQAVGSIIHDVGRGFPMQAWAQVTEAFASTSSDVTCKCALVMADDAALTSNLTVLSETDAIACAVLLPGYQFRIGSVPPGITKRYLGFRFTTAVHDATAGKVMAGFIVGRASVRVTS
jgi:hypothetical protein